MLAHGSPWHITLAVRRVAYQVGILDLWEHVDWWRGVRGQKLYGHRPHEQKWEKKAQYIKEVGLIRTVTSCLGLKWQLDGGAPSVHIVFSATYQVYESAL